MIDMVQYQSSCSHPLLLLEWDERITERIIFFLASPDLLLHQFLLLVDIVGNYSCIMFAII